MLIKYLPLLLISAIASTPAFADYKLIKGKGVDICEAYVKNLRSFPGSINITFRRPINPKFKEFSKPEWKKKVFYDVPNPSDLYQKINDFLFKRDANPGYYLNEKDLLAWKATKKQIAEARKGFMEDRAQRFIAGNSIGWVDIENDGKPDLVYYDNAGGYGQLLLILKESLIYSRFRR